MFSIFNCCKGLNTPPNEAVEPQMPVKLDKMPSQSQMQGRHVARQSAWTAEDESTLKASEVANAILDGKASSEQGSRDDLSSISELERGSSYLITGNRSHTQPIVPRLSLGSVGIDPSFRPRDIELPGSVMESAGKAFDDESPTESPRDPRAVKFNVEDGMGEAPDEPYNPTNAGRTPRFCAQADESEEEDAKSMSERMENARRVRQQILAKLNRPKANR